MLEKLLLILLKCVALLPLRVLYLLSDFLYFMIYHVVGYRKKVVRQNLAEAFPEKPEAERLRIEREFYRFLGDVIVETLKLLHISDSQLRRRVEVENPEIINQAVESGRCAALLMGHYGNWEWVQEISRYLTPDCYRASIYRPLNSKVWEAVYARLRKRWAVKILPRNEAPRALLDKAHRPWICGFIADGRPRNRETVIVPFLNHNTSVMFGPELLGRKVDAEFFFLRMQRLRRGYYKVSFAKLEPAASDFKYPYVLSFWREFEKEIKENPAYWLWSHKRWKYDSLIDN